jgi:hypothetical protein
MESQYQTGASEKNALKITPTIREPMSGTSNWMCMNPTVRMNRRMVIKIEEINHARAAARLLMPIKPISTQKGLCIETPIDVVRFFGNELLSGMLRVAARLLCMRASIPVNILGVGEIAFRA